MKVFIIFMAALSIAACSSYQKNSQSANEKGFRTPSATDDLTGDYLGEGLFTVRAGLGNGIKRPAIRFYLERIHGEADSYYGVLVEYPNLLKMAPKYLASQKAPALNKVFGYLNKISAQISAYKLVPGASQGSYDMYNLEVQDGKIVPAREIAMTLTLNSKNKDTKDRLAGAFIKGNKEGDIIFPDGSDSYPEPKVMNDPMKLAGLTQYNLAKLVYKKGKLASTWRPNGDGLQGSYLSAYGNDKDGVLELFMENGQAQAKFIKTNRTKPKVFTNPKSASLEGDYYMTEPIPKMYVMVSKNADKTTSDTEIGGRIGLFLDVFDGSAPEAGGHLVTELAFTNPKDPKDFMMYYQDINHKKNIGVEPKRK